MLLGQEKLILEDEKTLLGQQKEVLEKEKIDLGQENVILKDIFLKIKKRILGFYGRRVEGRTTEMAKMKRMMADQEMGRGFFHRIIFRK